MKALVTGLLGRVKGWLYIIGAVIFAGMLLTIRILARALERSRKAVARHKRNTEASERTREKERDIAEAQANARQEAADVADTESKRRARGDRPRVWGDSRLRRKD